VRPADSTPMRALRLVLVVFAVAAVGWFVLGEVQTRDLDRATDLTARAGTPSAALTKQILGLLDTASTLNPDRNVALLRSQAQTRSGRGAAAVRTALAVARAEPQNIDGWVVLGFAAGIVDPKLAALARTMEHELAPPVPVAP
jgi:hypothetical protein